MTPEWVIPALTFASGVAGGFAGARGAIVRLETQMVDVRARLEGLYAKVNRHNDDLLIHDIEIQTALIKLDIQRARRQQVTV